MKIRAARWRTGARRDRARQLVAAPARAEGRRRGLGALEKARAVGAKTQRERDWIEAIAAYYRDHDSVPLSTTARRVHAGGADDAAVPR